MRLVFLPRIVWYRLTISDLLSYRRELIDALKTLLSIPAFELFANEEVEIRYWLYCRESGRRKRWKRVDEFLQQWVTFGRLLAMCLCQLFLPISFFSLFGLSERNLLECVLCLFKTAFRFLFIFSSGTNGLVSPYLLYCPSPSIGTNNLPYCEDQQSLQWDVWDWWLFFPLGTLPILLSLPGILFKRTSSRLLYQRYQYRLWIQRVLKWAKWMQPCTSLTFRNRTGRISIIEWWIGLTYSR